VPYNRLEGALPETLGLIRSLRVLDVSFNKVTSLPKSIIALDKVCVFVSAHSGMQCHGIRSFYSLSEACVL